MIKDKSVSELLHLGVLISTSLINARCIDMGG